jgi:ribose-phosphate pyrophosphokinase
MKLLYSTEDYSYLAEELLAREDNEFSKGEVYRKTFPDGEKYMRLTNPHVKGSHCTILGGTTSTDNIFEILNLGYQLVASGAKKLSLVIPCFGYQTMERSSKPGEVVMAKTMAHWLSSIPRAAYGNEIVLLEPHTDTIAHYFSPDITTRVIPSTDVVMKACVELAGTEFVLGSTDVGRAKTIEYIQRAFAAKGRAYNIETAFVYKRRNSGTDTEVTGINADVKDKIVVIYDDMIRTGGSLIKAANIYKQHGAVKVYAVTTHGILPGDSLMNLYKCDAIEAIATTNSHPGIRDALGRDTEDWGLIKEFFVRQFSVAGLISRYA